MADGGEGLATSSLSGTGGNAYGGAIGNSLGAWLGAQDDTFSGNSATGGNGDGASGTSGTAFGGAVYNAGAAEFVSTTIDGNSVAAGTGKAPSTPVDGAGIYDTTGSTLSISDTIVADSTGGHDVVNLGTATGTTNLVMTSTGLPSGLVSLTSDPMLSQVVNSGGTTPTLVPLPGSPVIDAGNNNVTGVPVFPSSLPGLVGWWRGEGNTSDVTGNDNGTAPNGVAYGPGVAGEAFQFTGTAATVSIPNNAALDTSTFSFGGWFELTQAPPANSEYYLASKYDGNYHGWILRVSSTLVPTISLLASPSANANATSGVPLALNQWAYIAVTYDGTNVTLYINGVKEASASYSGAYAPSAGPLVLGGASWFAGGYASARVDEFAYFNQALTAAQVQSLSGATTQATDQRGDTRIYNGIIDVGSVESQPYLVSNTNDSGPGSLRQAIADDAAGDQPVIFAPSLAGQTITLTSGAITIKNNLTIDGPGAGSLTINGDGNSQIFAIDSGTVSISGLTFADGLGSQGGAIYNGGSLTVTNSVFNADTAMNNPSLNPTLDSAGGAIYNASAADLVVTGSTFSNDKAIGAAGPSNNANAYGGAIENAAGADLSGTNDTFVADSAQGGGAYGTDGYNIIDDQQSSPSYATATFSGASGIVWSASTTDPRALEDPNSTSPNRFASTAYATSGQSFSITVTITDGKSHDFTLYSLDYDSSIRAETIQVVNPSTGAVLLETPSSRSISSFHDGVYLTWTISGTVVFDVITTSSSNPVIAGVLLRAGRRKREGTGDRSSAWTGPAKGTGTAPPPGRAWAARSTTRDWRRWSTRPSTATRLPAEWEPCPLPPTGRGSTTSQAAR